MYRPQKKKANAGKDPRNVQQTPLGGDDRNLVEVDDAFSEADIEDRMWLFWQKNRTRVVGGIGVALVLVLAFASFRVYEEATFRRMQQAYAATGSEEALLEFGLAYAHRPLGAFALLEAADQAFADKDFSAAAGLYRQASAGLGDTPFAGRALLGAGVSAIKDGQTSAGEQVLSELARNPRKLQAVRAEAAYYLALLAVERGDFADARLWIERVDDMEYAGIWRQQAAFLRANYAELED